MAQLFVFDFDWWLDPGGYDLRSAQAALMFPRRLVDGRTLTEVAPQTIMVPEKPQMIVRRGRDLRSYQPLKHHSRLFSEFSRANTPRALLQFIERFGPLTDNGLNPRVGEAVEDLLRHAAEIRKLFNAYAGGNKAAIARLLGPKGIPLEEGLIGEVHANLIFDPASRAPRLQFRPKNLLNAIWLQLAGYLANDPKFAICQQCGVPFEYGPGTNRKAGSKFCSFQHKTDFFSQKRTQRPNRRSGRGSSSDIMIWPASG